MSTSFDSGLSRVAYLAELEKTREKLRNYFANNSGHDPAEFLQARKKTPFWDHDEAEMMDDYIFMLEEQIHLMTRGKNDE